MTVEKFFELFLIELEQNPNLRSYYKFLNSPSSFEFRKAYFCQRLQYILDNIGDRSQAIWDCGCGYGTTDIFLALNGYKVFGSTLEFYYKEIPPRLEFWKKHGYTGGFTFKYENLFDEHPDKNSMDVIIIQDTLHHLEPLQDALKIFREVLKPDGRLLIIEENGNNIIQNFKLYLRRGNKRIIEIYDEKLGKKILLGNENIRSRALWEKELKKQNFYMIPEKTHYIRLYPPFMFNKDNYQQMIDKEQRTWKSNSFLREKFFFGLNFIATKK